MQLPREDRVFVDGTSPAPTVRHKCLKARCLKEARCDCPTSSSKEKESPHQILDVDPLQSRPHHQSQEAVFRI